MRFRCPPTLKLALLLGVTVIKPGRGVRRRRGAFPNVRYHSEAYHPHSPPLHAFWPHPEQRHSQRQPSLHFIQPLAIFWQEQRSHLQGTVQAQGFCLPRVEGLWQIGQAADLARPMLSCSKAKYASRESLTLILRSP